MRSNVQCRGMVLHTYSGFGVVCYNNCIMNVKLLLIVAAAFAVHIAGAGSCIVNGDVVRSSVDESSSEPQQIALVLFSEKSCDVITEGEHAIDARFVSAEESEATWIRLWSGGLLLLLR